MYIPKLQTKLTISHMFLDRHGWLAAQSVMLMKQVRQRRMVCQMHYLVYGATMRVKFHIFSKIFNCSEFGRPDISSQIVSYNLSVEMLPSFFFKWWHAYRFWIFSQKSQFIRDGELFIRITFFFQQDYPHHCEMKCGFQRGQNLSLISLRLRLYILCIHPINTIVATIFWQKHHSNDYLRWCMD